MPVHETIQDLLFINCNNMSYTIVPEYSICMYLPHHELERSLFSTVVTTAMTTMSSTTISIIYGTLCSTSSRRPLSTHMARVVTLICALRVVGLLGPWGGAWGGDEEEDMPVRATSTAATTMPSTASCCRSSIPISSSEPVPCRQSGEC